MGRKGASGCVAAALAVCATACSSTAPPVDFPAAPLMTLHSRSNGFAVEVRTSPQPPTRGDQSVEYTVRNASSGALVTGLSMDIVPWMPRMNHGASIVPSVVETRSGVYVASNVDLFMSGEWALRTTILRAESDAGAAPDASSDYVSPDFEIP